MSAMTKVSLTMDHHALRLAKTAAERTGVSHSSLVNAALERHLSEVLAELQRRRAAEEIIATFPVAHLPSPRERDALLALWNKSGPAPSDEEVEAAFAPPAKAQRAVRRGRRVARAK